MKITGNNFSVTSTRYSRNGLKVGNFIFTLTNVRFGVLSMLAILTSSLVVVLFSLSPKRNTENTTAHRSFVISTGSCTFIGLWKIPSCLFIPNCTRNHVITYTSCTRLSFITVVWIIDRILTLLTAYSGRLRHLSQSYAMNECQMLWSLKTHLQRTELKQITNQ